MKKIKKTRLTADERRWIKNVISLRKSDPTAGKTGTDKLSDMLGKVTATKPDMEYNPYKFLTVKPS